MRSKIALAALALIGSQADALPPLRDPARLNIGVNCRWQPSCERRQLKAMKEARQYVARGRPPVWRIHLCNRNAARGIARIDWVGFNQCIRNTSLRPRRRGR
jgi:putative component of membrane protein insertase Oxa1/YidC/SpoIIIJ protein YidD